MSSLPERWQCWHPRTCDRADHSIHESGRVFVLRSFSEDQRDREKDDVAAGFDLNTSASAAFSNHIANESPVPLNTRKDSELGAQRQDGNSLPIDACVSIKDCFDQLLQCERRSHPKPLQDESLHDGPYLLDRGQVGRVWGPIEEDLDTLVAEPAHCRDRGMASRAVLLEK